MITHSITPYVKVPDPPRQSVVPTDNSKRFHGTFGTEEHKRFIHARVLDHNPWKPGDSCTINGAPCVVVHICEDFADVEWRGLECLCVEVFFYTENDTDLFHPSRLKEHVK